MISLEMPALGRITIDRDPCQSGMIWDMNQEANSVQVDNPRSRT